MASSAWHINQMGPLHRLDVWACTQSSVPRGGGGVASSAWHINQMGPPYRSGVWACIQSSVRWWSFRSHGGACSCRFLVGNCLQIEARWGTRDGERVSRAMGESVARDGGRVSRARRERVSHAMGKGSLTGWGKVCCAMGGKGAAHGGKGGTREGRVPCAGGRVLRDGREGCWAMGGRVSRDGGGAGGWGGEGCRKQMNGPG